MKTSTGWRPFSSILIDHDLYVRQYTLQAAHKVTFQPAIDQIDDRTTLGRRTANGHHPTVVGTEGHPGCESHRRRVAL